MYSSKAKPIPSSASSDLFDINFDVSSNISTPSANGSQPSTAAIPQELPSPIKPITTKPNSTAGSAKGFNNLSKDSTGDKGTILKSFKVESIFSVPVFMLSSLTSVFFGMLYYIRTYVRIFTYLSMYT